jgi:hypothetical protein
MGQTMLLAKRVGHHEEPRMDLSPYRQFPLAEVRHAAAHLGLDGCLGDRIMEPLCRILRSIPGLYRLQFGRSPHCLFPILGQKRPAEETGKPPQYFSGSADDIK